MIEQATIRETVISLLEAFTGCVCVPSNTTKEMPAYPYISFTVINTAIQKGTYSKTGDVLFKPLLQRFSFTVQGDDEENVMEIAMQISDFFDEVKRLELEDKGIVVAEVGAITPRDNLITIEYEYRRGLDVTLRLNNVISDPTTETVERVNINDSINIEKS